MTAAASFRPTPAILMSWLQRACAWASRIGVYLLPVYYVAFFATLFLLWREPQATFWLIAAGSALGWAMAAWALVFCLASVRRAATPAVAPAAPAAHPVSPRFVQVSAHACSHACPQSGGETGRFSAACFHARCTDVPSVARHGADAARQSRTDTVH
ncbi:hypothetical protein G3N59_10705 [Paraburkholderia sp. Ac-20340]|uniref:hypothetical protein n=1 Tax=Paraburkholderia sp. Ac-20340 TaxID=2703888 RepID=UPI001981A5CB|nr:hypothetical protein [Paraburkholderia sp. Ac-20340]MBN3853849.1 hypothetical protein [Paraburkholderia sp. Ac-20340]